MCSGLLSHHFPSSYSRSHSGYKEMEDGLLVPENPKYADQRTVFNDLGKGVLDNAVQGMTNACLNVSYVLSSGNQFKVVFL